MRLLIAGAWRWPMYEAAFARGLTACGVDVGRVELPSIEGRRSRLFPEGLAVRRAHRRLLEAADRDRPTWMLLWRPTAVAVETVRALQARGVKVATCNNDDPFAPAPTSSHAGGWARYRALLPWTDRNFVYRPANLAEATAAGARHVALLLPYFLPWRDRPMPLDDDARRRFEADVVFAGHYEPDGRADAIRALVDAGLRVRIWSGAAWDARALGTAAAVVGPIQPALDDDYARAISASTVALGFLSTANRDVYTRRCLEIPACGGVLLAPRTPALQAWFRDGDEACFYSSTEELVASARALVQDPQRRARVAEAGRRRVWADGHDVVSRARQWLSSLEVDA